MEDKPTVIGTVAGGLLTLYIVSGILERLDALPGVSYGAGTRSICFSWDRSSCVGAAKCGVLTGWVDFSIFLVINFWSPPHDCRRSATCFSCLDSSPAAMLLSDTSPPRRTGERLCELGLYQRGRCLFLTMGTNSLERRSGVQNTSMDTQST